jgi:hypothetical protein
LTQTTYFNISATASTLVIFACLFVCLFYFSFFCFPFLFIHRPPGRWWGGPKQTRGPPPLPLPPSHYLVLFMSDCYLCTYHPLPPSQVDPITIRPLNASSESLTACVALAQQLGWQRFALVSLDNADARAALAAFQQQFPPSPSTWTYPFFVPASNPTAYISTMLTSLQTSFVRVVLLFVDTATWWKVRNT